jgi:hypothetical protein
MMGWLKHEQEQLFYEFRLDEVIPGDHLVREIAAVLDLTWVRAELASYYTSIARRLEKNGLAPTSNARAGCRNRVANTISRSLSLLAVRSWSSFPATRAAFCTSCDALGDRIMRIDQQDDCWRQRPYIGAMASGIDASTMLASARLRPCNRHQAPAQGSLAHN